jgi:hypothetical protein
MRPPRVNYLSASIGSTRPSLSRRAAARLGMKAVALSGFPLLRRTDDSWADNGSLLGAATTVRVLWCGDPVARRNVWVAPSFAVQRYRGTEAQPPVVGRLRSCDGLPLIVEALQRRFVSGGHVIASVMHTAYRVAALRDQPMRRPAPKAEAPTLRPPSRLAALAYTFERSVRISITL